MEDNWLERTQLLLGNSKIEQLNNKHVLVVGLGGVGAYAAEMIARAGVGEMTIVDGDTVNTTNINRQLLATNSVIGQQKANLMAQRLRDINPKIKLNVICEYIKDDRMIELLNHNYDYVVDAIDTLSPKVFLIYHCVQMGHKIISCMGAGGRVDPTKLAIADISKTYNCKLAFSLRKRLRHMGVTKGVNAVFSSELVEKSSVMEVTNESNKKSTVGTISYMPALFGIYCASKVIRDLANL